MSGRRLSISNLPGPVYAVGDVHGHSHLYDRLEQKILQDAAEHAPGKAILVVALGDVIDRGPDSAGMIDRMLAGTGDGLTPLRRLSLRGNHEEMFLAFLSDPDPDADWLSYGGRETLTSYGLYAGSDGRIAPNTRRLKQMLDAVIPPAHIDWLRQLPLSLRLPGYLLTHAGANPMLPLAEQTSEDLMWSRPSEVDSAEDASPLIRDLVAHQLTLVHGHVPTQTPEQTLRRINLDTGAYASGRLTAARLSMDAHPEFLHVIG